MSRLVEAQCLYGMENSTYTEYIVERRLEICLTTCFNLLLTIQHVNSDKMINCSVHLLGMNQECLRIFSIFCEVILNNHLVLVKTLCNPPLTDYLHAE